jgi:hypothetical protein
MKKRKNYSPTIPRKEAIEYAMARFNSVKKFQNSKNKEHRDIVLQLINEIVVESDCLFFDPDWLTGFMKEILY